MSELAAELTKAAQEVAPFVGGRGRVKHPQGWEPGIEFDHESRIGTITLVTRAGVTPEPELIAAEQLSDGYLQFDPTQYAFIPTNFRTWESPISYKVGGGTQWLKYWRFAIQPKESVRHLDELVREIKKRKPRKQVAPDGEKALVVNMSDWQAGKAAGGGPDRLVERAYSMMDSVEEHVRGLRKAGVSLGALYIATLGDMVENCMGHYSAQQWQVSLTMRQQLVLARALLDKAIDRWSALFPEVIVTGVPGNHGEVRSREGDVITDWITDNYDLLLLDELRWAYDKNPDRYGHVRFFIPDDLAVALDVYGTPIGWVHGHQAKRGGVTPQQKLWSWWQAESHAKSPVGMADVLVSGHYHHYAATEQRTDDGNDLIWMQCPSLDGDSPWYRQMTGARTNSGTLTFVAGGGTIDWIRILR